MNDQTRTPQEPGGTADSARPPLGRPVTARPDDSADTAEARRLAAAHARSGDDHRSRADAALGEADAARGRSAEADARDDLGLATAEWSDAAGWEGTAADEATAAAIEARAASATATSTTVPPPARGGARPAPGPAAQGRAPAPTATAAPPRRVL